MEIMKTYIMVQKGTHDIFLRSFVCPSMKKFNCLIIFTFKQTTKKKNNTGLYFQAVANQWYGQITNAAGISTFPSQYPQALWCEVWVMSENTASALANFILKTRLHLALLW